MMYTQYGAKIVYRFSHRVCTPIVYFCAERLSETRCWIVTSGRI